MFEPRPSELAEVDIEQDSALWYERQIVLLRARRFEELDIENLIGELESALNSDRRKLKSRLRVLMAHLLKCQYQPQRISGSWLGTIAEQRQRIADALEDNPSYGPTLMQVAEKQYPHAARLASLETRLPLVTFPANIPYTREQLLDPDYTGA